MNDPVAFSRDNKDKESSQYRGKVVSIKIPRDPLPVLCVIQRSDISGFYFDATDDFLKGNVFLGDPLICQIMDNDFEYVFEGMVGNIEPAFPREVQFLIEKITKFRNKRKYRRYHVNLSASVFDSNKGQIYSIVRNISLGGVNMIFREKLALNSSVDVEILISKDQTLRFKARVCRNIPESGFLEYGMEIMEIDGADKLLLQQVVSELEEKENRFISNSLR